MKTPTLSRVQRFDSVPLNATYFTDEGYLIDHPIVTTCGIFEYLNRDGSIRRELRLPEEVFKKKSLESYKGKPIIITHDAGEINKDNVEDEIIGTILGDGYRDGNNVRAEIVIHDTDSMKKCGLRELSLGYNLTLDETEGEWQGQHYDAIQRNIEINHLALVDEARAGDNARLNIDGKHSKGGYEAMRTVRHDGDEALENAIEAYKKRNGEGETEVTEQTTEVTEQPTPETKNPFGAPDEKPETDGAEITETEVTEAPVEGEAPAEPEVDDVQFVKDRRMHRDSEGDPKDLEGAMRVIAQQDEDIDRLLKKIEKDSAEKDFNALAPNEDGCNKDGAKNLSGSLNMDSVDKLVSAKLELCRLGDKVGVTGIEKMSLNEGRKAIITAVRPAVRLDGKSDVYVEAMFDIAKGEITARKNTDAQRASMFNADGYKVEKSGADEARERMIARMQNKENGGNK